MGNFMVDSVVSEQADAVRNMVEYLSKKYGIDIHKTSIGHKECKDESCLLSDFSIPNLTGHREIGFTSCPGDNLFTLIDDIRKTETASIGRNIVINPTYNSTQVASLVDNPSVGQLDK